MTKSTVKQRLIVAWNRYASTVYTVQKTISTLLFSLVSLFLSFSGLRFGKLNVSYNPTFTTFRELIQDEEAKISRGENNH